MRASTPSLLLVACVLLALTSACGGYSMRLQTARTSAQAGNLERAYEEVDTLILRAREGRSPEERDLPLLLLERASILQALGMGAEAAADLTEADAMLEVLDLSPDRAGKAAEYLFSAHRTLYQPPVYEKLMVNVMAMSAFLDTGHIRDAMVEARRVGVLIDFFDDEGLATHPMLGAAAYLAGITMERGGQSGDALRFYLRAWQVLDAPGLPEAVVRLGSGVPSADANEVARARERLGLAEGERPAAPAQEVITIAYSGLAPYRVAERLPIGIVFAWMRQDIRYSLGEQRQSVYNRIAAEGIMTWVNFPSLVVQDNRTAGVRADLDGRALPQTQLADVESFALAQWESDRAGVAFSAITRMITRVLAREAIQAATSQSGNQAVETIGFLASLATQGAMQAADQPDTRTWSLMPAYVWVARTPVEPGTHTVTLRSGATMVTRTVEVTEGRSAFAVGRLF